METKKLISYFGEKAKSLYIQSYWIEGRGHINIETATMDITSDQGLGQLKAILGAIKQNGAKKVCINGDDFDIYELIGKD